MPERRTHALAPPALLLLLSLLLTAPMLHAAYVNAVELARANDIEYRDLSIGESHSCKLSANGRDVILIDGMKIVLVNGAAVTLSQPVQWNGSALMVPSDVTALFATNLVLPKPSGDADDSAAGRRSVSLAVPDRLAGSATVVIDPGHGGKDVGTPVAGDLLEKHVNLDIAKRVATYLQARGVKVLMTRTRDVAVELSDRTDMANRANADLFLCIHANSMPDSSLRGAMLQYPKEGVQYRAASRNGRSVTLSPSAIGAGGALNATVQKVAAVIAFDSYRVSSIEAAFRLQAALDPVTGLYESDGVMESSRDLHVLRETHCPTVVVEVDFLSNRTSARKLGTVAYRTQIAEAVGRATLSYLAASVTSDQ